MFHLSARDRETTLKCPVCGDNLHIQRSCQEVHMHCPQCVRDFPLKDFINKADKEMEDFLENIYFDRI